MSHCKACLPLFCIMGAVGSKSLNHAIFRQVSKRLTCTKNDRIDTRNLRYRTSDGWTSTKLVTFARIKIPLGKERLTHPR